MTGEDIPDQARQFIANYIISVEQLEILLLLSAAPDRFWTLADVYRAVQSSEISISARLDELRKQGFLEAQYEPEARYRFRPVSLDLASGVEAMRTAYQERRVKVIELIFSKTDEQIRSFAEAFRWKKEQ